jgi:outer membrane protein assembly factor BamB
MKILKFKSAIALTFIMALTIGTVMAPAANAQIPTRDTTAYLSVAPERLGIDQNLTVLLWVYPSPATRNFDWHQKGFKDITITFTRPDGTTDTFMPQEEGGLLPPGTTEMIGSIWFFYSPDQIGTWTSQFSMPEQTIGEGSEAVIFAACTSEVVSFEVVSEHVHAGLLDGWPYAPLPGPNEYWDFPIYSDNREWSQLSGGWLQGGYDYREGSFNPYTTAPSTGHILWKRQVCGGGLVGGDWGSFSYDHERVRIRPPVIMMGRIYYNTPGKSTFSCVDLSTGELLWEMPGSITLAQHTRAQTRDPVRGTPETEAPAPQPWLWGISSSSWRQYDGFTGNLEKTLTNLPSPGISAYKFREGDPIVYCIRQRGWNTTIPYRLAVNELIKWDYSKVTGNNWTTGIVWNVSLKQPDGTGPGEGERTSSFLIYGDKAVVTTYNEDKAYMYDTDTGQQLMVKDFGYPNTYRPSWSEDGVIITFDSVERQLHAYDFETLNELWVTEPFPYPWGSNVRYPTWAYGNFYVATYDGHIYCFDEDTGVMKWKFYCGNTTETVFKSFVPYLGAVSRPIVADGKVFMGTSEHTPTQPRIRFNKLFCVDAITGDHLWSISGAMETIVGQGYLVGANENDGCMYAFSKGKTETTVEAPLMPVAAGERITIRGTVMDVSCSTRYSCSF